MDKIVTLLNKIMAQEMSAELRYLLGELTVLIVREHSKEKAGN